MKYVIRFSLIVLVGLGLSLPLSQSHIALAQNDVCQVGQSTLQAYSQLDEFDIVNSITELQKQRITVESIAPTTQTIAAQMALGNMLHLKTISLIALTSTDQSLVDSVSDWEAAARAAHTDASKLVAQLCANGGLVIADFNNCNLPNNLLGSMGAAFDPPNDSLEETYVVVDDADHQCVARLEYDITEWAAFWLQLNEADFSPYTQLVFDIKADHPVPRQIKIELKRAGAAEWVTTYVVGITEDWQTVTLDLSEFRAVPWASDLSARTEMEELVFTFEQNTSGDSGVVYIDNIVVR